MARTKTKHRARADLSANREQRPNYRRRAHEEAFGIYRPLTKESAAQVGGALACAGAEVTQYLSYVAKDRNVKTAELAPRDALGATYLTKTRTKQAMRNGLLHRGFAVDKAVASIEDYAKTEAGQVEVPIGDFDWFDDHRRTFGLKIADACFIQELVDDTDVLQMCLERANSSGLEVQVPDHIGAFKYGKWGDRLDIRREQRYKISRIVESHFLAQGIEAVMLDSIVVGDGYMKPRNPAMRLTAG